MGLESQLQDYLKTVSSSNGAATQVVSKIEEVFDELGLPYMKKSADSWQINSDVGLINAGLDDDQEVLSFFQILGPMPTNPKRDWPFLVALLKMNSATTGACYAIFDPEEAGVAPMLSIVGRIAAAKLDAEEVALTLRSLFEMSRVFDSE